MPSRFMDDPGGRAAPECKHVSAGRKAWLVVGGLGSLAAAAFMIRDGGIRVVMDGQLVTRHNPASSEPAARGLLQASLQAMRLAAQ